MPRFARSLFAVCGLLALMPFAQAAAPSGRERILFDAGWRFHLASAGVLKDTVTIADWRWKADDQGIADAAAMTATGLDTAGADWKTAQPGEDTFKKRVGFSWYRTILPNVPGPQRTAHFEVVDDNATVYLNGKKLAVHLGYNEPFDVELDSAWKDPGPNVLAVLVENTSGAGGITGPVTLGRESDGIGGKPSDPAFDDSNWRVVHLPFDYVVEQTFTQTANAGHGSLPTPPAWFRKTFELPAADKGKRLWIDFDGIYRDAHVYFNEQDLGEHQSGYTPFRCDISKAAHYGGKNVLAVYVNPSHFEGWWYEGGGIYRHVWLNAANPLHIAPWGTFITSELPEPKPGAPAASAVVTISTKLENSGQATDGKLISNVLLEDGKIAGQDLLQITVPADGSRTVTQKITVANPVLWSLERPRLYHLSQVVLGRGQTLDINTETFGIRTIRFDADTGFYLNGKPVKIQGTCNHQDFPAVGIGVPDDLEEWRVAKLKEMGANAWRMSHNPPTTSLLDACDKLGMLVMDENRHLGDTYTTHSRAGTPADDLSDLAEMIQRDRNHPSIIIWSMCNEEGLQKTPDGARIFSAMMKVVHRYDTTRPISCAMNGGWFDPGFRDVEDLAGVNYHTNVYDRFHELYPKKPLFASETASTTTTRGVYDTDKTNGWVSSYRMTDGSWEPVGSRPFVAGSFVWTGFDYKGEPTPFKWPDVNSNFGILDMCGFPKDNYYYYQSWWKTKPIVHLMPHWNWPGREGQEVHVIAFSNCARVELFLNGKSLGAQDMPRFRHLDWKVNYAPGILSAKGYDANGKVTATDSVETTGDPAALKLVYDRTVLSGEEDVLPVEVDVVDAKGRIVPTANNLVTFAVTGAGRVAGVGNGNPSDHDPDRASYRHAFNGKCMVIVGEGQQAGLLELTATSPGLTMISLQVSGWPEWRSFPEPWFFSSLIE